MRVYILKTGLYYCLAQAITIIIGLYSHLNWTDYDISPIKENSRNSFYADYWVCESKCIEQKELDTRIGNRLSQAHQMHAYHFPRLQIHRNSITARQLSISDNPFRYCSYYFDMESGMNYCKARYYSPELMEFTTLDTWDVPNRYAYCNSDPVSNIDANGHLLESIVPGSASAIVGSAVLVLTRAQRLTSKLAMPSVACGIIGTIIGAVGNNVPPLRYTATAISATACASLATSFVKSMKDTFFSRPANMLRQGCYESPYGNIYRIERGLHTYIEEVGHFENGRVAVTRYEILAPSSIPEETVSWSNDEGVTFLQENIIGRRYLGRTIVYRKTVARYPFKAFDQNYLQKVKGRIVYNSGLTPSEAFNQTVSDWKDRVYSFPAANCINFANETQKKIGKPRGV